MSLPGSDLNDDEKEYSSKCTVLRVWYNIYYSGTISTILVVQIVGHIIQEPIQVLYEYSGYQYEYCMGTVLALLYKSSQIESAHQLHLNPVQVLESTVQKYGVSEMCVRNYCRFLDATLPQQMKTCHFREATVCLRTSKTF